MKIISNAKVKFKFLANSNYLFTIVFLVPIIGLILEYFFDMAFARSGAVLVSIAIFCVYLNHFVSVEEKNTKSVIQAISKIGSKNEEFLKNMSPEIHGELRNTTALNLDLALMGMNHLHPNLILIRENLVKAEFFAGFFGTIIWGFGDLVPY